MLSENPGKTTEDFRPLEFRKGATEQLEKDFNEAFEGKYPGSATEPRRHRAGSALKVKCSRMKKFRDAFGFHNTAKGGDDEDSAEWSDDESSLPAKQLATASSTYPLSMTTSSDPCLQRRQQNMAEEESTPELDTLAFRHRRIVRAQAEQHWVDSGVLFPSEDQINLQMRINLQNECVDDQHTAQHACVIRRLMRSMGMVVPEEVHVYSSDDEVDMEISDGSTADATNDKIEAEATAQEQDDEVPDIDGLEFEPEFFDEEFLGFDE